MNFYTIKQKDHYIGRCKEYPGLSYESSTKKEALENIIHLTIIVIEDSIKVWAEDLNKQLQGNELQCGVSILLTKNNKSVIYLDSLVKQLEECYEQLPEEG